MKQLLATLALLIIAGPALAQQDLDAWEGWREDLKLLVTEVSSLHPNPFVNIEQDLWKLAVSEVDSRLREISRNRFGVELQQLVALLGDAHTAVNPLLDPALSTKRYPIELYLFENGLYVRSASPEYADLVGGQVVGIGKANPGSAIAAVASTISYENLWWVRAWAPERLVIPEVLDGLGMVDDPENLSITVEKAGARSVATLKPESMAEFSDHGHGAGLDRTDWIDMREAGESPLWLRHRDDPMWYTWIEDNGTLYVCYRAVISPPEGPSNQAFWDEVFAEADRRRPRRMVIDIRENAGGNGMLNRAVIQQIVRRPHLDQSDRLFVIIGRKTFSAAQQLANQFDWWTQATFVGEPTGQKVSQYGDADRLVLPNSGITVSISTRLHQAPGPQDIREFIPPDLYAPLTSESYRTGVDPALEAIFESETREPAMAGIRRAFSEGRFDEAERLLIDANLDPTNRYRNYESDINGIGYDLLGKGQTDAAIAVFMINTRVYPSSANTFDSLGEALRSSGKHAEAVEAYRRALEIDPTLPSSVEALRRLEAETDD